VKVAQEIFW
jgi:hypothetical protein